MARTERTRMDDHRPEWLKQLWAGGLRTSWWLKHRAGTVVGQAAGTIAIGMLGVFWFGCLVVAVAVLVHVARSA